MMTGLFVLLASARDVYLSGVYVNQIGISLASPITVRVVLALGPVAVFALQLAAGRFRLSAWSLGCALVYSALAVAAAIALHARIRAAAGRGADE